MYILFTLLFGIFSIFWVTTAFVLIVPLWKKVLDLFPSKTERDPIEEGYKYPTI